MSLDLKPVQVRLPEDAYAELKLIADASGKELGEVGRELLTRVLLGEGHAIRLTAERFTRAITSGKARQRAADLDKARG
jgi:hypothetical protein